MSMEYIRKTYGVPAKRGMRVLAYGRPGTIVGAIYGLLKIRLDGSKHAGRYHPTDGIEYEAKAGKGGGQ